MIKVINYFKQKSRGQSFLELAIVLGVLLLLLTGMVEFGNLLNVYINLTDGAREGARFGSNNDPYISDTGVYDYSAPQQSFYENIDTIVEGDTNYFPVNKRTSAIAPIVLDPDTSGVRKPSGEAYLADNVLITFYSVDHGQIVQKLGSWSKYNSGNGHPNANQISRIPTSVIETKLDPNAPGTGIVVVEVFYNYEQLLKLPLFTIWVSDPIPVHAYAIMPLAGAEATPTP